MDQVKIPSEIENILKIAHIHHPFTLSKKSSVLLIFINILIKKFSFWKDLNIILFIQNKPTTKIFNISNANKI